MAKIKPPAFNARNSISGFVAWTEAEQSGLLSLLELPRNEQVMIIQYKYPWFKPKGWVKPKDSKYTKKWWDSLTGDQQTIRWALAFPSRCRRDGSVIEPSAPPKVSFYDTVSEHNALSWYADIPQHLKKTIDAEIARLPGVLDAKKSDALYQVVAQVWGDRPELPEDHVDGYGLRHDEDFVIEVWREWARMYTEELTVSVILAMAPTLQKERMMLNQALGLSTDINGFPLQVEGLDDTQAATVRWIQETGQTPIEVLVEMYRDPEVKVSDRIQAARAMLDFVHRKLPVKQEVETKDITEPKLAAKVTKGLSDKELAQLEALLKKMTHE